MYNTDLVEFTTSDNFLLPGLLFTPKKPTSKVAIFLHGNGSSSVFYLVKRAHALAESLCSRGIALSLFNNRGAHYIKKLTKVDQAGEEIEDVLQGTSYELIKDVEHDVNGVVNYLKKQNFQQFFLVGHSTGANKICVYDHYQPENIFEKYVLLGGGDDTGLYFQECGDVRRFKQLLENAKKMIDQQRGRELVSQTFSNSMISYQSFFDIANPDGDYNCFPFIEYLKQLQLSSKPLFRYFTAIKRPSLVVYGENDQYAAEKSGQKAIEVLSGQTKDKKNFEFKVVNKADHSFHGFEKELGELIAGWLIG